jgi:hypothetical protein
MMGFSLKNEFLSIKNGLTMSGGDWGSFTQLFFDNLSTLLGALYAIQALGNKTTYGDIAVSTETMNLVVWERIAPGVGLTMVVVSNLN